MWPRGSRWGPSVHQSRCPLSWMSGIPVITGQHLNYTLLEDRDYRFITEDHADKLAKSNVQQGDIVLHSQLGNIGQDLAIFTILRKFQTGTSHLAKPVLHPLRQIQDYSAMFIVLLPQDKSRDSINYLRTLHPLECHQ